MGIKIKNLPEFTGLPDDGDYFAVTDQSVTSKLNYTLLAQAVIEDYAGSTMAGSAQSAKDAIDALYTLIQAAQGDIEDLQTVETAETTYSSSFANYSSGANPHFYKFGRVCMVYGTAKPSDTITGGTDLVTMFTFPDGFIPVGRLIQMQQASGQRMWTLTLQNGTAYFSRCRSGASWYDATTTEWLPFNAVYICE